MNTLCMARVPGRARFPSIDRATISWNMVSLDCLNADKCVLLCG